MRYISLDVETDDPLLNESGPSWTHEQGRILVTGLFDVKKQKKGYIDGKGGETVRSLLLDSDCTLIGANLQYDIGWMLYVHSVQCNDMKCGLIDVQICESLIDEYQPFTLEDLAKKYLNEKKGYGELPGVCKSLNLKGDFRKHLGKLWDMDERYRDMIRKYVISDADQPARIWEQQKRILVEQDLMSAFDLNMGMLRACIKMKQRGVRIDYEQWKANCELVKPIHDKLQANFYKQYGEVNINSPKQLGEFMDKHNIPYKVRITVRGWEPVGRKYVKKTDEFQGKELFDQKQRLRDDYPGVRLEKNKLRIYVDKKYAERTQNQLVRQGYNVIAAPNLDKFFLKDNKASFPLVADLVELKQVKSIIQKFLGEKFSRYLVYHEAEKEWRIHGSFNPVGARQTSRLSSSLPNLQNIPSKTILFAGSEHEVDLSVMCREVFLPEKDSLWYKLDFSGQENRLMAHFAPGAHGEYIRKLYNENPHLDEHQFVATESGLEEEYGKKGGRKYAKNVRFGLGYGLGAENMSRMFGWDIEFCKDLIEQVKDASPWFVDLMAAVQDVVAKRRYIKTLGGRRIHLRPGNENKLYPFMNYLVQGSAADETKTANVQIDQSETVDRQTLTVHDEIDGSLPMNKQGLLRIKALQYIMEHAVELDVPMVCEPEIGSDWAHLEGQKEGETVDELWDRVCKELKEGRKLNVRTFDMDILELEEDDDDESDEED